MYIVFFYFIVYCDYYFKLVDLDVLLFFIVFCGSSIVFFFVDIWIIVDVFYNCK